MRSGLGRHPPNRLPVSGRTLLQEERVIHELNIWRLRSRRRRLDQRLRDELGRRAPDLLAILALRRRKHQAEHELILAEVAIAPT